jgi:hypothetical protein
VKATRALGRSAQLRFAAGGLIADGLGLGFPDVGL